jgi:DNA-binding transcriptional LysR family regulator
MKSGLRDMPALLDRGELDLSIGTFEDAGERFAAAPLLEDSFVVAMRRDHPAAQRELTEEALAGLSYLEISSSGEDSSFVDQWLDARGLARNITHRPSPVRRRHPLQHRYGGGAQPPPRRALGAVLPPFDLRSSLCIARYPHRDALASSVRRSARSSVGAQACPTDGREPISFIHVGRGQ